MEQLDAPARRPPRGGAPTRKADRDLVVAGSASVAHALMDADLVDEYRLLVFPTVVGEGTRLFEAGPRERRAQPRVGAGRRPGRAARLQSGRLMRYAVLIYEKPGAYDPLQRRGAPGGVGRVPGARPRRARRRRRAAAGRRDGDDRSRRTTSESLITDGPFADTKEVFGGFYLLEADDLDARAGLRGAHPRHPPRRLRRGAPARGAGALIEQAFRDEWGRVLASLIGFLGDFDLAEEAAQEAFAIAAERWPRDGAPRNPGAWLTTTARNRAIDRLRRERTLLAKTRLLEVPEAMEHEMDETTIPDERLELIFTCCHPALALEAQVALTLSALGGLDDRRDRRRLPRLARDDEAPADAREGQDQGGRDPVQRPGRPPASRPPGGRAGGRLPDLQRGLRRIARDLADEAIRLGRAAHRPHARRVRGPRAARADAVPRLAARGALRRRRAGAARRPGPLAVGRRPDRAGPRRPGPGDGARRPRAATCCRRRSPRCRPSAEIDWPQVAALYGELARVTGSPVVELNRAVAVAQTGAPEAALGSSTASRSTTTATCTRRGPSCCAGSVAPTTRARPIGARST